MSKESAMAVATGNPAPVESSPGADGLNNGSLPLNSPSAPPSTPQESEIRSKQFSHLAKKEAELHRQREEVKAERAKIQEAANQYQTYLKLKETDPIGAMKMLGFSETDIFNYMAAQQPQELTPEQKAAAAAAAAADEKIKAFEENQNKKQLELDHKADTAIIESYKNNISSVIKKAPDTFEYCSYYGPLAEELIFETVQAIVKDSNGEDVPTPLEAAQMVETYYEEQDKQMSMLKKRQPKPVVETPAAQPTRTRTLAQPGKAPESPTKPVRTLHSGTTTTAASARVQYAESRADKRERLMERLRNGE